jgi:hypothetical protein
MTKRFVVVVDDATKAEQDVVTNWLKTTPLEFWHYLSDLWLVADGQDQHTTITIRDQLKALLPQKTVLILTIDQAEAWAARGPVEKFKWLHTTWSGKSAP